MKVIKPQTLGLLYRVLDDARQPRLVVVVLGFFAFGRARLLPEAALWPFAAKELGPDAALDECLPKTRGEALVCGHCYTRAAIPVKASHVRATVGPIDKRLAVIGDRSWREGLPTGPEPFLEMPVTWDRAFGGPSDARNPLGKGVPPRPHMRSAFPLPNVETWLELVRLPTDRPEPAGFLPIDPGWPQRAKKAGTYDDSWLRERFPGFAADVDDCYFQAAPRDQQLDGFFQGGEPFRFENMHPSRPVLEGRLPELGARAFIEPRGGAPLALVEVPLRLDTVWLFPHAERGVVAFRGVVPIVEDDAADVATILVAAEATGARRSVEHYRAELAIRSDRDKGLLHALSDKGLVPELANGRPEAALPEERNVIQELLTTGRLEETHAQRGGERMRDQALAEARAIVTAQGLDPDAYVQVPEPPPRLPDPKDIEAVVARIEQEERAADARAVELKAMRAQMETDARRACEEAGVDYDAAVARARREAAMPPRKRADEELARLRRELAAAKAHGSGAPELEAKLDSGELEAILRDADRAARAMYAEAAHAMDAPTPQDGEAGAALRAKVVAGMAARESFANTDLTGADLSGLDLQGACFDGALLAGARLSAARAARSSWVGAVLAHADLSDAGFDAAKMHGCNLGGARLTGARFVEVDLAKAILRGADLSGADLSGATLEGADISEAKLVRVLLRGARLVDLTFLKSDLRGAILAGATLTKATFIESDLSAVDFEGADLGLVSLVGCCADGARFAKGRLHKMHAVQGCSFAEADFSGASLAGAFLRGSNMTAANFDGADLRSADLSECSLRRASLRGAVAREAMFVRADLTDAVMIGVDLLAGSLSKATLHGADLRLANLFRADLSRIALDEATKIEGANVKQARIWPRRKTHAPP
jgi:uncharacterized protein YjbI with pentapeptide repeats